MDYISLKKAANIFLGPNHQGLDWQALIEAGQVPTPHSFRRGPLPQKGFSMDQLPLVGERIGQFKRFDRPLAVTVFTTKGGVLKSTLALNLARVAALHNIKTCVVGLDMQGDVTSALGYESDIDEQDNLDSVLQKIEKTRGLMDYFQGQMNLEDLIVPTDLPGAFLIPETAELVALNDALSNLNRREFWIKEKVVRPLLAAFDLVIMDCSPNWNRLTTNALVASDVLISPLECKINNFRNFKVFRQFLKEFAQDMHLDLETIFVPTRYSHNRRLALEIKDWYQKNVPGCTEQGIVESAIGEEATALHLSILEHACTRPIGQDFRRLMDEIHVRLERVAKDSKTTHASGELWPSDLTT